MQSPLANVTNLYTDARLKPPSSREGKPYRPPQPALPVLSMASFGGSSASDRGSPTTQMQKLQSDLDCWQLRYEALEKQYTAKLSAELAHERREKVMKDERAKNSLLQMQVEELQQTIMRQQQELNNRQLEIDNAVVELEHHKHRDQQMALIQEQEQVIKDQTTMLQEAQQNERMFLLTISQQKEEIFTLRNRIEQLNVSQAFETKIQEVFAAKQSAEQSARMKEQEFNALKKVFHEKELELQESLARHQHEAKEFNELDQAYKTLQAKLEYNQQRERSIAQFKIDVQAEVEVRVTSLVAEVNTLKETLSQKQLKIKRLRGLQSSLEHYQKEFVKAQLTQETLSSRVQQLEKQCERFKRECEMCETLLKQKTQHYEENIRMLEKELLVQSESSEANRRLMSEQVEQLRSELESLEETIQQGRADSTNWRTQFIRLNRDYHFRQEQVLLLETELQIHRNAIRDCKMLSTASRM